MNKDLNITTASGNNGKEKKKGKTNSAFKNYIRALILIVIAIIVASGAFVLLSQTAKKAASSAKDAYSNSKNEKENEIYAEYYQSAFNKAEKKFHVSNRATINIENIKELSELEVLSASDVEYVISDTKRDNGNVWLEVTGEGVYTTDMSLCEVIADQESNLVLVRVPSPVLSHVRITNRKVLLYTDKGFRDYSYKDGTDLAEKMEKDGYEQLRSYMKSNANYYKSAQNNAESLIKALVKECNPNNPDLIVMVEFYN